MARTGLEDISTIKDPLMTYNFGLIIPNVPGGGDGQQLLLRCMATNIPGMTIEPALVQLRGMELQFAGRHVYDHNLPVTYLEARDVKTRTAILRWMYLARDFRNNSGSYKSDYSTNIDLELYDDTGLIVRTIRFFGCFPLTADAVGLESGSSTPAQMQITFSYDYFRDVEDL